MNNLDIVPRLLGKSLRLTNELAAVICLALGMALPQVLQDCTSFVPFGTYHMLKDGQLQSMDSSSQPSCLRYSFSQVLEHLQRSIMGKDKLASQFIADHKMKAYQSSLERCMSSMRLPGMANEMPCECRIVSGKTTAVTFLNPKGISSKTSKS